MQQIQAFVDQGRLVLIPTPVKPSKPPAPVPPLRDPAALAAAFALLFKLGRGESEILMRLVTQSVVYTHDKVTAPRISLSRERILDAIARDPARPNKTMARELGVSPTTVRKVRQEGVHDARCRKRGNNISRYSKDSVHVYVCALRKQLAPHGIEIDTLYKRGYGLNEKARRKIYRALAKHDALILATASVQRELTADLQNSQTAKLDTSKLPNSDTLKLSNSQNQKTATRSSPTAGAPAASNGKREGVDETKPRAQSAP
jgi:hypothetical protein